jgi:hypothetical protein
VKLTCEYFIVCERVIEDTQSRTLTAVALLEQVSARTFPALHKGFACAARFRIEGSPPPATTNVGYRVFRSSAVDAETLVVDFEGEWDADTRFGRVVASFEALRLVRPEQLLFRIEHRVADGPWVKGPSASLDIVQAPSSTASEPTQPPESAG